MDVYAYVGEEDKHRPQSLGCKLQALRALDQFSGILCKPRIHCAGSKPIISTGYMRLCILSGRDLGTGPLPHL